jgi:hypothetical protein
MKEPMFADLACVLMFAALFLSCTDFGLLVSHFWCPVTQGMMHAEDYRKRKPQLKKEVSK